MSREFAEKAGDLGKAVVWATTMALIVAAAASLLFVGFPPEARSDAALLRFIQRGVVAMSLMAFALSLLLRYTHLRMLRELGGK